MAAIVKKFFVNIEGVRTPFDTFEEAARFWDRETFTRPAPAGGLEIEVFEGEVMVRQGWLVHISTAGTVYINPLGDRA